MYYKSGDTYIKSGDTFLKLEVKSLTFQVDGNRFPLRTASSYSRFFMRFSENVDVTVNYGDGVSRSYTTQGSNPFFGYDDRNEDDEDVANLSAHYFQDGNTGLRNITFEFSKIIPLIEIHAIYCRLVGSFPNEIIYADNLKTLNLNRTEKLLALNDEIIRLPRLEVFVTAFAFETPPTKIPDSVFDTQLKQLNVSYYELSNNENNNFYKINQLKETLEYLAATAANLNQLPSEIFECFLIYDLRVENNNFLNIDERLNLLINLTRLYFGNVDVNLNNSLPDFNNLSKLSNLYIGSINEEHNGFNYSDIVTNWIGLKNLSNFIVFQYFCRTDAQLNAFIPPFYQLCTENGFLDPSSQAAIDTGYPNQFRSINWGHVSLSVNGTVEAPPNFHQGISNGDPVDNGHLVYILMANYSHNTPYLP